MGTGFAIVGATAAAQKRGGVSIGLSQNRSQSINSDPRSVQCFSPAGLLKRLNLNAIASNGLSFRDYSAFVRSTHYRDQAPVEGLGTAAL